ncbi:MAG: T9SS type A sorting domain-containing protein [Phycisphaerae bacterium]|nr:T9SS type A sorting domain-containing protein [Saprospiraceae bacterium]
MKKTLFFFLLLFPVIFVFGQPTLEWQKSFGGSKDDGGSFINQTSDGGYIMTGNTLSNDGDVSGSHGLSDGWVIKTDSNGQVQWKKVLGGSSYEAGYCIQQTTDGGYILVGSTLSNNGDVSGNHGGWDCWVVKLNNFGDIQWQRVLGGSLEDRASSIRQTIDGGYIMAGYTASIDGDVTYNHGNMDYWVVKLNNGGDIEWQKTYGGTGEDEGYAIQLTSEGGYVVMGSADSKDGDVPENHGNNDYWVVKLNNLGEMEWQKALGGSGTDDGRLVIQTSDGGYLVGGTDGSSDGQVVGGYLYTDFWIVKLDANGAFQWQKSMGGNDDDILTSILETAQGKYLLCGLSYSRDGDVVDNDNYPSIWLVEINELGEIQWQKTLGGTGIEYPGNIEPTNNGGYILIATTDSNDGDVSGNHGKYDLWVVKLSPESSPTKEPLAGELEIYPNPSTRSVTVEIPGDASEMSIELSDMTGRTLLRKEDVPKGGSIELAYLPAGVYFVKAITPSGKVYQGKVRKE